MRVQETTVSRNTLSRSVEGSFYFLLSAGRDRNLEVTSSGCLEADEVTGPLCRQLCPGEWRLMWEELCILWRNWNSLLLCGRTGLEAAIVPPVSRWNTAVVSTSLSYMPNTQLCMVQTKNQGLGLCSPTHIHWWRFRQCPGIRTLFSVPTLTHSQCLQAFWLELSFASFRGSLVKPTVFRLTTCGSVKEAQISLGTRGRGQSWPTSPFL